MPLTTYRWKTGLPTLAYNDIFFIPPPSRLFNVIHSIRKTVSDYCGRNSGFLNLFVELMCTRKTFNGKAFKLIFKQEVNWTGFFWGKMKSTCTQNTDEEAFRERHGHDYTFWSPNQKETQKHTSIHSSHWANCSW